MISEMRMRDGPDLFARLNRADAFVQLSENLFQTAAKVVQIFQRGAGFKKIVLELFIGVADGLSNAGGDVIFDGKRFLHEWSKRTPRIVGIKRIGLAELAAEPGEANFLPRHRIGTIFNVDGAVQLTHEIWIDVICPAHARARIAANAEANTIRGVAEFVRIGSVRLLQRMQSSA